VSISVLLPIVITWTQECHEPFSVLPLPFALGCASLGRCWEDCRLDGALLGDTLPWLPESQMGKSKRTIVNHPVCLAEIARRAKRLRIDQ